MDRDAALKVLGLGASATADELETARRRIAAELDERIESAATDVLKAKYRAARDELERAAAAIRMHGTDQSAPVPPKPLNRQPTARRSSHGNLGTDHQAPGDRLRLSAGRVLAGRFEIRRRIGVGPTGAVFAALDRERGEEIAIKVFLPGLLENERAIKRFSHEVGLARELSHPGIVNVFGAQRDGELHFITMELLEGTTLRQRMDALSASGQPFSVHEVLHVGVALSDTLGYAHQHTVHCGVKPENVFLCADGMVMLTDFGIGRLLQATQSMTVGISMRTASYLAPEQLKGSRNIDHRVDQYATAAVLYEMLTGEAPAGRVRPATDKRPDTPRALSKALDRALESDPADRFPDMEAFATALPGRSSSRLGGKRPWVVTAVAVLLLVVGGATFPRWRDSVSSMIRSTFRDPEVQAAAETTRMQALASAATWQKVAQLLADDGTPEAITWADEALAAGNRYFEAMAYSRAEESFRQASELYESQVGAATQSLRDEPLRVAQAARDLYERLATLERELYGRVADLTVRLNGCKQSLRNARTDQEQEATEARCRTVEAELGLLNRLKSLTQPNVFNPSLRAEIRSGLIQADRQLEDGRYRDALWSYAKTKARLEELLAWPDQAESALRKQSALSHDIEQLRSALSPAALALAGVQSALDDAAAQIAGGDQELAGGRVPEAVAMFESAGQRMSEVKVQATAGLFARAQSCDNEGKLTAAVLALDELLALDPDHAQGQELRRRILSYRVANSIGMELVFIPPGEFLMGSPSAELGRDEDERHRPVRLTKGFYMGTTEVTQSQWSAVMGDNPSKWKGDDLPVEQISWEDAWEFCHRLSDTEGRQYRLPTEAEWGYACRAGTTTPFSYGETISTDQANYDGDYVYGSGAKGVFRNQTVPVAGFPANAWGLYDMHGNVWEWCPDGYEDYPPSPVKRSTQEPPIEGRVLRGGSWRSRPRYCRCANRVRDLEDNRLSNIGFRVVLESD